MKILAITALTCSLALCGSAFAQSSSGANNSSDGTGGIPETWQGGIGDTFFSDSSGTMRSGDEVKSRWGKLSADQQAQVRSDCESVTASTTSKGKTALDPKVGAESERTGGGMASACDWVNSQ